MNRFGYIDILKDVLEGLKRWRIWTALSWNIIKMEYRRTMLGPLWIALQHAIFIIALGKIFSSIQQENFTLFFIFFATGYTVWLLIASFVTSAGNTFLGINGLPNMTKLALSNHIYMQFASQILLFIHKAIPLIIILLIFQEFIDINCISLAFGIMSLLIFGFWVSALLGCLSLRFQDLIPAVNALMQVMFFITPVMYKTSRIPDVDRYMMLNPFYHLLVVVRASIIDEGLYMHNWIVVLSINVVGIIISVIVLRWSRPKIAFWAG